MTSKSKFRPSPALVISCLALFLAFTGSALAIGKNTVRSAQIVDGTVRTIDLRDNAVTSPKIADATVTADDLATDSVGSDEIAKDAVVLLFSQDKEQWGAGFGRHLAQVRPDKDGKYSVRSLAPGEYYAVALEKLDQQRFPGDPDYFELLSRDAERFTLVEEETRTVDLKLTVQQ